MGKTIPVSEGLHRFLTKKKVDLQKKTFDALLRFLLELPEDEETDSPGLEEATEAVSVSAGVSKQ